MVKYPASLTSNRSRILILGLILTFSVFLNAGQEPEHRFRRFTQEHGLSINTVSATVQGPNHFLWVATRAGLNRFDGYQFKKYTYSPMNRNSLSNNNIRSMILSHDGHLWLGLTHGINRFNPVTETFDHYVLPPVIVNCLVEDDTGTIWAGTQKGLYTLKKGATQFEQVHIAEQNIKQLSHHNDTVYILTDYEIYSLNSQTQEFKALESSFFSKKLRLYNSFCDQDGMLWVASYRDGLFRIHPETGTHEVYKKAEPTDNIEDLAGTLPDNRIDALYQTSDGTMWIATQGLLCYLKDNHFTPYYDSNEKHSPQKTETRHIYSDRLGNLWISTERGLDQAVLKEFNHYIPKENSTEPTLLAKAIYSVATSNSGVVWFGGKKGITQFDYKTKKFSIPNIEWGTNNRYQIRALYAENEEDLWFMMGQTVYHYLGKEQITQKFTIEGGPLGKNFQASSDGGFWIATSSGLISFQRNGQYEYVIPTIDGQEQKLGFVNCVAERDNGNLYLGTKDDLLVLNQKKEVHYSLKQAHKGYTIPMINDILLDQNDIIWFASEGAGFNRLDEKSKTLTSYTTDDGLVNNSLAALVQDDEGRIWISTFNGLSCFDPKNETFKNFTLKMGLQSNDFNPIASLKTADGTLFFGGVNGFNFFHPQEILKPTKPPPMAFTGFSIFNKPIKPNNKNIWEVNKVDLDYTDRLFSLSFATLDLTYPEYNTYQYQMVGLSSEWVDLGTTHQIPFSGMNHGNYTLKVRGADYNGTWNTEGLTMKIFIKPPWWHTKWAYTLYVLIILGLIATYVRYQQIKLDQQKQIAERERKIAQRLRLVDEMRDKFLANTSHELRTPLNGIIGLAESLRDGAVGKLPDAATSNLHMIVKSGRRLANLVNDILDFSQLKNKKLTIHKKAIDMRSLADVVITLSQSLIGSKGVELLNTVPADLPAVDADENRLLQIMHNLVGNAIKFTETGQVSVTAEIIDDWMHIGVHDTGIGIEKKHQNRIFESFEQADGSTSRVYGGTGLGLSVTEELVRLHGGKIWVESVVDKGSSFIFTLPLSDQEAVEDSFETREITRILDIGADYDEEIPTTTEIPIAAITTIEDSPLEGSFNILIVDDEEINRQVLLNHLSLQNYHLTEAVDGYDALQKLDEQSFDLILLDVMMPRMSGYEVCQKLRLKWSVEDLPVIILTAKNQVADLVAGFASGANDYLTKPVNRDELLPRVKTHLQLLEAHRMLEQRVRDRTSDLVEKNKELDVKNKEILEAQNHLIMQAKQASLGTLTAGIAHEIRNPLNFVNNFAGLTMELFSEFSEELAQCKESIEEEAYEYMNDLLKDQYVNLERVIQHGEKMNYIVQSMMDLARNKTDKFEKTNLNILVDNFTNLAYHGAKARDESIEVTIHKDYDENIGQFPVVIQDMDRVVINLVNNALEAIDEKRKEVNFEPQIWITTKNYPNGVTITIKDNGVGIPEEHREQLFNPFFTTKSPRSGNIGLGLTICYDFVVQVHAGEFEIHSVEGEFTEVKITIPRFEPRIAEESAYEDLEEPIS